MAKCESVLGQAVAAGWSRALGVSSNLGDWDDVLLARTRRVSKPDAECVLDARTPSRDVVRARGGVAGRRQPAGA